MLQRFRAVAYALVVVVVSTIGTDLVSSAYGAFGDELLKLTPSDAEAGDEFGTAVAIKGNVAVIGAYKSDDVGLSSGSAYIYDLASNSERFKLTASDGGDYSWFGASVAVTESVAVIGAFGPYIGVGGAYVYDLETGNEKFKLLPDDTFGIRSLGRWVAADGETAVIGAPDSLDRSSPTRSLAGAAYVFDLNTGDPLFRLVAHDRADGDEFGASVAVGGNAIVVGSPYDEDVGAATGSAYVFDRATGDELWKLTANDADAGDFFGSSVAVSGNHLVVGSPFDDDAGSLSGSAYVFDLTTGEQLFKLTADDAAEGDRFGGSVAVDGHLAVIGARADDGTYIASGSAYVFDLRSGAQLGKLTATDAAFADQFGNAVAVDGSTALVGAHYVGDYIGATYVFDIPEPGLITLLTTATLGLLSRRPCRSAATREIEISANSK